jgi:hypothetical protein
MKPNHYCLVSVSTPTILECVSLHTNHLKPTTRFSIPLLHFLDFPQSICILRSLIRSKRKIYWGTSGSSVLFRTNPNNSDATNFTSFSLSETDPSLLLIQSTTNWPKEQTWLRFGMISRRMTRSFPLQMKYLLSIPPPQTSNKADS